MKTPIQMLFRRLENINKTMLDSDEKNVIAGFLKNKDEWVEVERNLIINAYQRGHSSDGTYVEAKEYYDNNFRVPGK
jgi:NAD-dependent DNA ligase